MSKEKEQQEPFLGYSDNPEDLEPQGPPSYQGPKQSRSKTITLPFLVFVITSLLWSIALLLVWLPTRPRNLKWDSRLGTFEDGSRHPVLENRKLITCGNSSAEAEARGCQYDILLNNWVPAPCVDQDWIDEYMEDNSWIAYADEEMTMPLKVEEMKGRDFYWTSFRDHINHCTYIWKKQFYVLYERLPTIDTIMASAGHTDHCAEFALRALDTNQSEATIVHPGFAGCWITE